MDSFKLKLIVMVLMVLDHLFSYVPNMPVWFTALGRLVSPVFFYFIVEGFFYTRSRKKYVFRLFSCALIMFSGSYVVQTLFPREHGLHNNIFLSLGMGVVLLCVIDWIKNTKKYALGTLALILVVAVSLFTEASIYGVAMTLVFYFFKESKLKMSIAYIIVSLMLTVGISATVNVTLESLFLFDLQWMMIFALPLILSYNGQRGLNTKFSKYLFYAFYPLHLWIIYIIGFYK